MLFDDDVPAQTLFDLFCSEMAGGKHAFLLSDLAIEWVPDFFRWMIGMRREGEGICPALTEKKRWPRENLGLVTSHSLTTKGY